MKLDQAVGKKQVIHCCTADVCLHQYVNQLYKKKKPNLFSVPFRLKTWVDFDHRQKKFEVACLVAKKTKLDQDMCFSNGNMLEKYVLLYSFLDA